MINHPQRGGHVEVANLAIDLEDVWVRWLDRRGHNLSHGEHAMQLEVV